MLATIKSFESDFDNASEYEEAYLYIESFFDIIEDDNKFKDNVILALELNSHFICNIIY